MRLTTPDPLPAHLDLLLGDFLSVFYFLSTGSAPPSGGHDE